MLPKYKIGDMVYNNTPLLANLVPIGICGRITSVEVHEKHGIYYNANFGGKYGRISNISEQFLSRKD